MIVSAAFIAAICVFVVGGVVIWSNPSRWVNRFVFSCSVCIGLWLMFLHLAVNAHDGLFWLRWTTGISAIIPLQFWLVKQAITYDGEELRQRSLRHAALWIVATIVLATIPFTEYFIPAHSTDQHRIYGPGYFVYITGIFALYVVLGINGFASVRRLQGEKRLTLQVWLGGGCATALTILLLMAISALTKDSRYIRLQPFAV
ncbi:MAG TPA: hypothetical protein VHE61_22810, partial [Opitutaceae bacterium]|nr:hypothetical protein [Opitutaceae bacterium]